MLHRVEPLEIGSVPVSKPYCPDDTNQEDRTITQEKDEKWLAKLEKRFNTIAGDENQIDLEKFKGALNVKKSFFAERFFELIDTDRSGSISLKELIGALRLLVHGTATDKLKFLFQVYDADGSGFIDFEELKTVLHSCTAESALTLSDETLTELTEILFDDADVDGDGQVSFEELSEQLRRYPSITANLSISAAEWLNPRPEGKVETRQEESAPTTQCCSYHTIRNHFSLIVFGVVYAMINAALIIWGALEGYWSASGQHPAAITVARSTGRCLSFNSCFVLVLMLRKLLTMLRNSFLMSVLPLDQHIIIHKAVGIFMVVLSIVHVVGHGVNFALIEQLNAPNGTSLIELLFTPVPGVGWVGGSASITGWLLVIVLAMMTVCSMPFIRRNGYFKVFFWTHQLCIVFWLLLFFHTPTFYYWFIAPGLVYLVERVLRLQMYRRARFGITYIQEGYILPANVVHVVIQRPPNFKFQAGEYIYVNIPSIASHEWHPFTISSAPEQQEFISLHIRSLGHWTKRLYEVFKQREDENVMSESPDLYYNNQTDLPGDLNKPLEVLAEEGSIHGGSPHGSLPGSPSMKEQSSHVKTGGRKLGINGETNSAFEAELAGDHEASTVVIEDSPVRGDNNNKLKTSMDHLANGYPGVDIARNDLPGGTTAMEMSDVDRRGQNSPLNARTSEANADVSDEVRGNPSISPVKGRDPALETSQSIPTQGSKRPQSPPGSGSRPDSSLARRIFAKKMTEKSLRKLSTSSNKRNNRKKVRRNPTLHSLDVSRTLGGTPHTNMEIILDGPYGSPAQHIMEAEHAVLIGAGIGITPFASILQSIHERYKAAKKHCPNCHHAWVEDASSILKTKKVDFFWINRQQRSFEWFISLLTTIELEQAAIPAASRFLNIHLYMTSALSPSDMKAIGLHVALDLIHKKNKRDTITGLMTRTQPGRPDWEEVFQNLKREQKGRTTVFFCGSPALGKVIRTKCLQYKMDFRKENF